MVLIFLPAFNSVNLSCLSLFLEIAIGIWHTSGKKQPFLLAWADWGIFWLLHFIILCQYTQWEKVMYLIRCLPESKVCSHLEGIFTGFIQVVQWSCSFHANKRKKIKLSPQAINPMPTLPLSLGNRPDVGKGHTWGFSGHPILACIVHKIRQIELECSAVFVKGKRRLANLRDLSRTNRHKGM